MTLPRRLAVAGVAGARVVRRRPRLPALHRVPELDHATLLLCNQIIHAYACSYEENITRHVSDGSQCLTSEAQIGFL